MRMQGYLFSYRQAFLYVLSRVGVRVADTFLDPYVLSTVLGFGAIALFVERVLLLNFLFSRLAGDFLLKH